MLYQLLRPVVNLSGKLCISDKKGYEMLETPSGCGDFVKLNIENEKILTHLEKKGIEYVCCMGVENILEKVIDPYMLGMAETEGYGGVYKCTYPENENENLSRIVLDKKLNSLTIDCKRFVT